MQTLMTANEELGRRMPLFINHESARMWFKREYGSRFVMVNTSVENNIKFYIYHIVHDKIIYLQSMNAIREGSPFVHSDFRNSFDEIEISEEGFIFFNERGNQSVLSK